MINLLIMGKPGAGKGTQASKLLKHYDLMHISTGEIFREEIEQDTAIGREVESYIEAGDLVPDDITNDIVEEVLHRKDYPNGFMLDGYPRTRAQAEALDDIMEHLDIHLTAVINVSVDDDVLLHRMAGRRVCPNCGKTYHVIYHPPKKEGICDVCGHTLIQREDDKEESVLNRLSIYNEKTRPLLDYYEKKGLLMVVDGEQPAGVVFNTIIRKLGELDHGDD